MLKWHRKCTFHLSVTSTTAWSFLGEGEKVIGEMDVEALQKHIFKLRGLAVVSGLWTSKLNSNWQKSIIHWDITSWPESEAHFVEKSRTYQAYPRKMNLKPNVPACTPYFVYKHHNQRKAPTCIHRSNFTLSWSHHAVCMEVLLLSNDLPHVELRKAPGHSMGEIIAGSSVNLSGGSLRDQL